MTLALLCQLWLHEPGPVEAARGAALVGSPPCDPVELSSAYADIFLLNVYPYGTIFTQPDAELNGPEARSLACLYAEHGYQPPDLLAVGAPDHLGLALGFLDYATARGLPRAFALACGAVLAWAPVACLAVEREPGAHAFYRSLAAHTRETLLLAAGRSAPNLPAWAWAEPPPPLDSIDQLAADGAEVRLRDLARFFLAPARSGLFLSRACLGTLGRRLGLTLPFGSRLEVAKLLFTAAGQAERLSELLAALAAEASAWIDAYRRTASAHPVWSAAAEHWQSRSANTLRLIAALEQIAAEEARRAPAYSG